MPAQGVEAQTLANVYLGAGRTIWRSFRCSTRSTCPGADPARIRRGASKRHRLDTSNAIGLVPPRPPGGGSHPAGGGDRVPPPPDRLSEPLSALISTPITTPYAGDRVLPGDQCRAPRKDKCAADASNQATNSTRWGDGPPRPAPGGRAALPVRWATCRPRSRAVRRCPGGDHNHPCWRIRRPSAARLYGLEAGPRADGFWRAVPPDADSNTPIWREASTKLQLSDAALGSLSPNQQRHGLRFRCGFLGLLHMEIDGRSGWSGIQP